MNRNTVSLSIVLVAISLCFQTSFAQTNYSGLFEIPAAPDYSKEQFWAALPTKKDFADLTPTSELIDNQSTAEVDVFFIYPTTLTKGKPKKKWNADLNDEKLRLKTEKTALRYQASIFNGAGKIYAPFYRQAHIKSFKYLNSKNTELKKKGEAALGLAYEDIKVAFEYYIKNYNNGRPIILVGHSQGARHGANLLKDYFDGSVLEHQLVAAYIVGMPIPTDLYESISICNSPKETGCFVSWRTFKSGHYPKKYPYGAKVACVNPISWKTDEVNVPNSENKGAVLRDFQKVYKGLVNAQVKDGLLWCNRPKFPGSWLLRTKNYHAGDFNLFYMNVRENAILRVKEFLDEE